jgi:hypothetical protein
LYHCGSTTLAERRKEGKRITTQTDGHSADSTGHSVPMAFMVSSLNHCGSEENEDARTKLSVAQKNLYIYQTCIADKNEECTGYRY